MAGGRPKKELALKNLQGTARHDRQGGIGQAVELLAEIPNAPRFLSEEAKAEWRITCRELFLRGALTSTVLQTVAAYCHEMMKYWKYEKLVQENGDTITYFNELGVQTKVVIVPEVTLSYQALNAATRLRELIRKYEPAKKPGGNEEEDPLDALIGS